MPLPRSPRSPSRRTRPGPYEFTHPPGAHGCAAGDRRRSDRHRYRAAAGDRGERVRLVTRSGGGPERPAVERVAADASDADALSRLAEGASVIYSCAGPAYHRWVTDWPPLGAALLGAAQTSGALLVTTGNLYGYGAVDGPMTEGLPLRPNTEKGQVRVRIWNEAPEAHRAGRIRTAEVRSSDYLGAGAVTPLTLLVLPKVLAGKRALAPADLDAPHSWTYTGYVARPCSPSQRTPDPGAGPGMCRLGRRSRSARWRPGPPSWPAWPRGCPRGPTRCCGSAACSIRWPVRRGRPSTSSGSRSCWTPRPPGRRSVSVRHHWTTRCTRRLTTALPVMRRVRRASVDRAATGQRFGATRAMTPGETTAGAVSSLGARERVKRLCLGKRYVRTLYDRCARPG